MMERYPDEDRIRFRMYMESDALRQALRGVPRIAILQIIHRVMDEKFQSFKQAGSQPELFEFLKSDPKVLGGVYAEIAEAMKTTFNLGHFSVEEYTGYITMLMAEELDRGRQVQELIKNCTQ